MIDDTSGIGSIAAGGRYDSLVGMFSSNPVPCVGVSIGIERVYAILSKRESNVRSVTTQVYVAAVDGQLKERFLIAKELWDAGISADFMYKNKPKIKNQLSGCEKLGIPLAVIIGQNEVDQGIVKIKNFSTTEEIIVKRTEMIAKVSELLK
jgi:histidyl-tRNA synthetase